MEVAASTVVKFGAGADSSALVVFGLDDVLNVDASGNPKTRFAPGDDIFVRLHHDPIVALERMAATHGMIDAQGVGSRDIEQQILWQEQTDEGELTCIPSGGLDVEYYGSEAVGLKRSGQRGVVVAGGVFPALSLVKYTAGFYLYRLIAPQVEIAVDDTYPITIVAYMGAAA